MKQFHFSCIVLELSILSFIPLFLNSILCFWWEFHFHTWKNADQDQGGSRSWCHELNFNLLFDPQQLFSNKGLNIDFFLYTYLAIHILS